MSCFIDFLKILGQLNLFYGLVLEMWTNSEIVCNIFVTTNDFFEFVLVAPGYSTFYY